MRTFVAYSCCMFLACVSHAPPSLPCREWLCHALSAEEVAPQGQVSALFQYRRKTRSRSLLVAGAQDSVVQGCWTSEVCSFRHPAVRFGLASKLRASGLLFFACGLTKPPRNATAAITCLGPPRNARSSGVVRLVRRARPTTKKILLSWFPHRGRQHVGDTEGVHCAGAKRK